MFRRLILGTIVIGLLFPTLAGAFPQVPDKLKPNPRGLVRPKHLGSEWPHLNIDEKLYSMRYTTMRQHYDQWSKEHTEVRTSTYPGLQEQFGMTAFKILPPDYFGRLPHIEYHQPFTEMSANISGQTGLIDMPSAFTQKKGVWLGSFSLSSGDANNNYFNNMYQEYDASDMRFAVTYGYRDDTELTATMNVYDRDISYVNGARRETDGRFLFGLGGKTGFSTSQDRFQIAVGGMYTFFSQEERDIIRIYDYHSISNIYAVASTDERLFNAHVMYKFVSYDYRSSSLAPTAQIGTNPNTGLAPAEDHWGVLGLGFEYKVPRRRLSFITEFTSTGPLDFLGRKDKVFNFGIHGQTPGGDYKLYTRMLNNDDADEIGLITTFHW